MKLYALILFLVVSIVSFSQNKVDEKGRKQGPWKKTYLGSSVVHYEGQFKDDKPVGTFKYYYPSRSKQAVIVHNPNSNRSYAEFYHENGNIMSKGIYRNMLKDSIWLNYAPSGRLSVSETFHNDTLNGIRLIYYLSEDLNVKDLKVASSTTYKNGKVEGEKIEYFDTGVIKSKGTYVNNVRQGVFITNHPNGNVMNYERYKNGALHGWCYVKDESGNETNRNYFYNGQRLEGKELEKKLQYFKSKGINPNE